MKKGGDLVDDKIKKREELPIMQMKAPEYKIQDPNNIEWERWAMELQVVLPQRVVWWDHLLMGLF